MKDEKNDTHGGVKTMQFEFAEDGALLQFFSLEREIERLADDT